MSPARPPQLINKEEDVMKFPRVLHVTIETPANEEPYLVALNDGVMSLNEPQRVAIYQLVKVGRVNIQRAFVETPRRA